MKPKRLASRLMFLGGIIELLIAVLHFIWPFELVETSEYAGLTGQYRDLLFLSSISIGLCLCIFGILSIYFSRSSMIGEKPALIYGVTQAILWGGRTIGELLFPVSVAMYLIENPTMFVLPLSILLSLLFLTPLIVLKVFDTEKHTA